MSLRILFLNPYHGGSHAAVAEGYAAHTRHVVQLLTLPIYGGWRWRMRGAAVTLARLARQQPPPDLIITTDMLDVATFRALYGQPSVPLVVYFHENQLTYPLPQGRSRDLSFAWTNYTSCLAADAVLFNSRFHQQAFLGALPALLGRYHDYQELETIAQIGAKAHVAPPGIDLQELVEPAPQAHPRQVPTVLWNGRWEYDKQPEAFFAALEELDQRNVDFRLMMAGEHIDPNAPAFVAARERWTQRLVHWGYADRASYVRLLHQADIVVSTAVQEFFGIGIVEALACGCIPILPKRLTDPDLLPATYHADCLYDSAAELVEKLQGASAQVERLRQIDWQAIAHRYDWNVVAAHYDSLVESVVEKVKNE
ncbi:MAG: DUF3524 domain-containing protein [Chloroflexaceae bacterium]|nr:DUF3524 domain-containing protein [Chloroflexaceae bacterium]